MQACPGTRPANRRHTGRHATNPLADHGQVGLWLTEAFTVDQETAPADKYQRNPGLAQPATGHRPHPGPWRLGYSGLEGPDGFTDDDHALLALNRQKITDAQHLTAHLMAGHNAFVTSDHDDLLRNREAIRRRTGIMRYYALTDPPEFPLSRPLLLLRRPGDSGPLEHFGRGGCWRSDSRPGLVSGEDLGACSRSTPSRLRPP